jgi:hypothetical protein
MKTSRKIKFCVLLFCVLLIYGCSNHGNKKNDIENSYNKETDIIKNNNLSLTDSLLNIYKNAEYFSYKRNVKNGIYDLEIETIYKNDTLVDDIPLEFTFPVIINQKLIFKKNDAIMKIVDLPFKKIKKRNKSGAKIEILEMSIWLIYSVKGIDETVLFEIEGTGLCMVGDCPEYDALFSEDGNMLFQCHYLGGNRWKSPCVRQEVLKKQGITNDELRFARDKGTLVDFWRL